MTNEEKYLRRFATAMKISGLKTETGDALAWAISEIEKLRQQNQEMTCFINLVGKKK